MKATLQEVIKTFDNASVRVPNNIKSVTYNIMQELKVLAQENSPIGDGTHGLAGLYKASWLVNKDASSTGMISSYSLFNTAPQAQVIEEGSVPGMYPWMSVGPRTMHFKGGNIFSTQAYEGVVSPLIKADKVDTFAKRITDGIMDGFA